MSHAMFGDTVTLYNHYREGTVRGGVDCWQRTVLCGVQVRRHTEKTVGANGVLSLAQGVSITIPATVDAGGRHYINPRQFGGDEKYWTLDAKGNLDVLVMGECQVELSNAITLRDLARDTDYVTLKAVSDHTGREWLKHWRVMAV